MADTLIPAVNHAAAQSDRWLFLACLVIMGIGGVAAVRWLVGEFRALTTKMASVVESNTDALNEVRSVIDRCRYASGVRQRSNEPDQIP